MRDRQCLVYAHLSIVHSFRRSFLSFFSLFLSLSPPFPSLDPCSSWGRPDSSIKPINPRQPMAARCSHWDPSIDHSVSLCSLSLSFHGRSPFFLASTGSLLFEYQLRPPNLFNERLINVKAHRQKGHCRRRPDFPLSLSLTLARLRKLLLLVRLLVTRTRRKRRKVGRVVGIIAIGFAEEARGLSSLVSLKLVESSVCQNRGKCWPDECLL